MASPCLANLCLLRLVNVAFGQLGFSASAQAFFSLHYSDVNNPAKSSSPSIEDLLYVSETISAGSVMNFGVISLPTIPQQSFRARVKIWLSPQGEKLGFTLFYDISLDTRNLQILEKADFEKEDNSMFASNALVWEFDGQKYCLRAHLLDKYVHPYHGPTPPSRREKKTRMSYTVDDARHMASLVVGLRDFDNVKALTSAEIDSLISKSQPTSTDPKLLLHSIAKLDELIARQESANELLESQIFSSRSRVRKNAQIVETDFPSLKRLMEEKNEILSSQVPPLHELLAVSVYPHIISAIHHVISVIVDAFPIDLAHTALGHYSISGIEFPSSITEILSVCYNETPHLSPAYLLITLHDPAQIYTLLVDCVNAGLSEIVAALNMLSLAMGVPLKYEMTYAGSQSFLVEHLSPQQVASNNRSTPVAMHVSSMVKYPLYYDMEQAEKNLNGLVIPDGQKHPRDVRFERGLALLNRNLSLFISEIESLYSEYTMNDKHRGSIAGNIPLECLDHFLWNLHYIMLFVTAPSG